MKFKKRTLDQIADMICGNFEEGKSYFPYRSSSYLTQFFQDADTDFQHDGTTRKWWVSSVIETILEETSIDVNFPSQSFLHVIATLMDQGDATNEGSERPKALELLNAALSREGFEGFYADDRRCYLRNSKTKIVSGLSVNPHRPMSQDEIRKKDLLEKYLDVASEDNLIEEVLLPLFRQLGFQRITNAGHKDKALEYGKDIWMRYVLPTQHVLYFGIQVKKGKLDSSGMSRSGNANVAEIYNQVSMMIGHEIFDPEINNRVLVDHMYIIAGGEITKAARNWLGNKLDATRRSQIIFMDREDILNLFTVSNVPLPEGAVPVPSTFSKSLPF